MLVTCPVIAADTLFTVAGSTVPLGDGIEFALTDQTGCRTRHSEAPLMHGAVVGTGERYGMAQVCGCWERLPDGAVRVYVDEWRPEYQVTTVPAGAETIQPLITDRPPRQSADHRPS